MGSGRTMVAAVECPFDKLRVTGKEEVEWNEAAKRTERTAARKKAGKAGGMTGRQSRYFYLKLPERVLKAWHDNCRQLMTNTTLPAKREFEGE